MNLIFFKIFGTCQLTKNHERTDMLRVSRVQQYCRYPKMTTKNPDQFDDRDNNEYLQFSKVLDCFEFIFYCLESDRRSHVRRPLV